MNIPESLDLNCGGSWPISVLPYGRESAGTPVIMLHGLESHSAWFAQSASHIADLGYPVYGMERRGSGHSEAPRGVCNDYNDLLSDIDSLADKVMEFHEVEKFHLLGHCFGAIPAAAYACAFPTRLTSLILATPALYTIAEPSFNDKLKVLWAALTGSDLMIPVPLEADWFTDQQKYLDFIKHDSLSLHEAGARLYWETARARRYIHANQNTLTMPVFMALAGRDQICDNLKNRAFFDRLPATMKRCSTFTEAVHILEFSTEKLAFLSDLGAWFDDTERPSGLKLQ
jgi:alpha-beta hydrolase superfamily lysophospholipase